MVDLSPAAAPPDDGLEGLGIGDLGRALEQLQLPIFVVARDQRIAWLNAAAVAVVGDLRGRRFVDAVAPESRHAVRDAFARKLVAGGGPTMYEATFLRPDGGRVHGEVSSVPLEEAGHAVGVFGAVVVDREEEPAKASPVSLTPRQGQTLRLLARGASTTQMAEEMGVAPETARNHVRHVLRRLGVHSRLEAVLEAHRRGLV